MTLQCIDFALRFTELFTKKQLQPFTDWCLGAFMMTATISGARVMFPPMLFGASEEKLVFLFFKSTGAAVKLSLL